MPDFDINIVIKDGRAIGKIRQVRSELDRTEKKARSVRSSLSGLFAGFGAAVAIREFINLSNAAVAIDNRLKIVSDSTEEVNASFERLAQISRRTRSPLEENTALFQRAKQAQKELGASNEDLFKFVEATGTALAIQGGAANTARGALIQLSQAVGATVVRAEEFNSILEGALPLAQAAARGIDEAGGSVAKLRQLVIKGEISSSEFFRAIVSQQQFLEDQFARTNATIGQSFVVLRNNAIETFREFDQSIGITTALANAILFLADNLDTVARILASGAIFFAITRGATLALQAITLLRTGWIAFTVAFAANPIGLALTAISLAVVGLISVFTTFQDQIRGLSPTIGATVELILIGFRKVKDFFGTVFQFILTGWNKLFGGTDLISGVDGFIRALARQLDKIPALFIALQAALEEITRDTWAGIREIALRGLAALLRDLSKPLLTISGGGSNTLLGKLFGVEEFEKTIVGGVQLFADTAETLESIAGRGGTDVAGAFNRAYAEALQNGPVSSLLSSLIQAEITRATIAAEDLLFSQPVLPADTGGGGGGSDGGGRGGGSKTTFADIVKEYERGIEALQRLGQEQRVYNEILRVSDKIGRELTDTEKQLVEQQFKRIEVLERASEIYDDLNGRVEDYIITQQALNDLLARGAINDAEAAFARSQSDLVQDLMDVDQSLGGQFSFDSEIKAIRDYTLERSIILQQAREQDLINEEEYQARLRALTQASQREILDAELNRWDMAISSAQGSIGILLDAAETYAGKQSGIYKGLFLAQKAFAIAEATINTFRAISNALAAPFPPPIPQTLAAAAAVAGGAQVAAIVASTVSGLKDGGKVSGPGGPRDDAAGLFALSNGEFVVNAAATAANLPLLEAINRGMKFGAMQSGGLVSSTAGLSNAGSREVSNASKSQAPKLPDLNNSVNVPVEIINVRSEEEALAAARSKAGVNVLINNLSENAPAVRNVLGLEN